MVDSDYLVARLLFPDYGLTWIDCLHRTSPAGLGVQTVCSEMVIRKSLVESLAAMNTRNTNTSILVYTFNTTNTAARCNTSSTTFTSNTPVLVPSTLSILSIPLIPVMTKMNSYEIC